MFRTFILYLTLLLVGCVTSKDYGTEHVLESRKNKDGNVIYSKVKTLYKTYEGDQYQTKWQEFDSLGRKLREYGFGTRSSPYKSLKYIPGKNDKYLQEYYYVGTHAYLINLFIWPTNNDSIFIPSIKLLANQEYIPDSLQKSNGLTKITITKHSDSIAWGTYEKSENIPTSSTYNKWEYYEFKILISHLKFDQKGLLQIGNVLDTFHLGSQKLRD